MSNLRVHSRELSNLISTPLINVEKLTAPSLLCQFVSHAHIHYVTSSPGMLRIILINLIFFYLINLFYLKQISQYPKRCTSLTNFISVPSHNFYDI